MRFLTADSSAFSRSRPMAVRSKLSPARRVELAALAALLLVAIAVRIVGMDEIEPNVLGDEADHLSTMYQIMAGRGPGPLDLSWDGNPAFQLYPSLVFVRLFGMDVTALRLSVAVASVLMLAAFYLVSRRYCSPLASLAATGLLAFSEWALFFSRNGEVNVFIALYTLLAAWSLLRALDGAGRRYWALAGFWSGMGWYGFLAGVLILPALLVPLPLWLARHRAAAPRLLRGLGLLLAVFALTVAPRVPALIDRWAEVER